MPIGTFIIQPTADYVLAAYRPVVIRVAATRTDGSPTPPVVYCDIYFNDVFYKTIGKTQYAKLNAGVNTEWQFDIQDAAQEYLKKFIGMNGAATIVEATPIITKVQCKLRSSGFDNNGFITTEGTAPVQGTSSSAPVSGTGTASTTFYIVNATLQHEDNQDLLNHLFFFKKRTWTAIAFPLTHRPDNYRININQSDTFPLLYLGTVGITRLRLNFRYCGQQSFNQRTLDVSGGVSPGCTAVISTPIVSPNSGGYEIAWTLISGSPIKYVVSCPDYNDGNAIETTDTAVLIGALAPGSYVFTVRPVCLVSGEEMFGAPQSVTIVVEGEGEGECVPAGWSGSVSLPDGEVGIPYSYSFNLTGTAPFTLSSVTKPSWMTIAVISSTVQFSGTPDVAGEDVAVFFTVNNCFSTGPDQSNFSDTIEVIDPCQTWTNPGPENAEGVSYTDCNEVVHNDEVITPGSNICIRPGTLVGPSSGVLEYTGICGFQVTQLDGVGLGNSEGAACGSSTTVYVKTPYNSIVTGAEVFQDNLCLLLVTESYIRDGGGTLWNVSGGVIGSPTGNAC